MDSLIEAPLAAGGARRLAFRLARSAVEQERPGALRPRRQATVQDLVAPFAQRLAMGGEADLFGWWQFVGGKEADLGGVIARLKRATDDRGAVQNDDAVLPRIVEVAVDPEQRSELDDQASFFFHLAPSRLLHLVAVFDKPAGHVPAALPGLEFAARQQDSAPVLDETAGRRHGIAVQNLAAASAHTPHVVVDFAFDQRRRARRAEPRFTHSSATVS